MSSIDWPTIHPYLGRVTAQVFEALGAIMVQVAQRLQLTENEQIPIALMRHDVIDDSCDRGSAFVHAHTAQRLRCEL